MEEPRDLNCSNTREIRRVAKEEYGGLTFTPHRGDSVHPLNNSDLGKRTTVSLNSGLLGIIFCLSKIELLLARGKRIVSGVNMLVLGILDGIHPDL